MSVEIQDTGVVAAGQFDSVIVGTSPVGLIEALHLAHAGQRVLVVDGNKRAGGSWATIDLGPFRRVEMGPHFIKWREGLYEMTDVFGFDMKVMKPQPQVVLAHSLFGIRFAQLNWQWLNEQSTAFAKARLWHKPLILSHIAYTTIRRILHLGPGVCATRYPADGCQGLIDGLCDLARRAGVEICLDTLVTNVEASSRDGIVRVALNGVVLDAKEFVFTSAFKLDEIIVDGKPVDLKDTPQIANELIFVLENNGPPRFSWMAMRNKDSLLHMVSDVTAFARGDDEAVNSLRVIAIRLRPGWPHDHETLIEVMRRLCALEMIATNARVVEHRWMRFSIPFRSRNRIDALNALCGPNIRALYTYDIGISLLDMRARWAPTLAWLQANQASPGTLVRKAAI